jgi:hypothetical protein
MKKALLSFARRFKNPRLRYFLAWLLFVSVAAVMFFSAWVSRNNVEAAGGNDGHYTIDFGGQWLMGRMLLEGHGKQLYDLDYAQAVISEHYDAHDTENLTDVLITSEDADGEGADGRKLGGAIYPPINCFMFVPFSALPPRLGYRVAQVANLLEALLAGWAIVRLSRGRVWFPIAAVLVMWFFGFASSMALGQNATLTLAILLWGWVFMAEDKTVAGGALWGLLAFKPVWAIPFLVATLLTRRWRATLAMGTVGFGLIILTLPFVGWQSWLDWIQLGKVATAVYRSSDRWILLSRDILGIPRRWIDGIDPTIADVAGWTVLGSIFVATVGVALARRRQSSTALGPMPAFVLLGMWLCCFHFMYYDMLLVVLPLSVLLLDREYFLLRRWSAIVPLILVIALYLEYPLNLGFERLLRISAKGGLWDTCCLIAIWAWCGVCWLRTADHYPTKPQEPALPEMQPAVVAI